MPEEIKLTEETFKQSVAQKISQGVSFVLAVYMTLEEYLQIEYRESGFQLGCQEGCSLCCYQLVTCTEIEIREIFKYIHGLSLGRKALIRKLKKDVGKWNKYFQSQQEVLKSDFLKATREWIEVPCCFLRERDGTCLIYPVRTIDCRTYTSSTCCMEGGMGNVRRFRSRCEEWANNLILEEQKKITGNVSVTPLIHWVAMTLLK